MSDQDIKPAEALAALLASDGWTLFRRHVESQYGADAYAREMDAIITEARRLDRNPEIDICALAAVVRKVRVLMQWPEEQVAQAKAKQVESRLPRWGRG